MRGELEARSITIEGHGGDEIEAYLASPIGASTAGGVVVIHHMPGYDDATKEITRRFAAEGFFALCPNLYSREAPGASPDDAAAVARANGGVPDERLIGDVAGAAAHLRSLASCNGRIGTIGYCSGGRQSFLAACSLELQAAVDCYGAFVAVAPPEGWPSSIGPVIDLAEHLSCPLLGLFGGDDQFPSPEQNDMLAERLRALGKDFDFHTYEGAGHAFFNVDRPSFRPEAAMDGWQRILAFFGEHLGAA